MRTFAMWSAAVLAMASSWPLAVVADEPTAADYYVRDLPGLPADVSPVKMHAGHIEVNEEHHANLFFWHFQNAHIANKQRTVIWINGGPGCSSEDGALMEIGPYRVREGNQLEVNNGSWNEFANLLFVDNPAGTGFSYIDTDSYLHELDAMAEHFIIFLKKFFALFPQYEDDDIYIAGESYAGQHIPYIARAMLDRNHNETQARPWNLKGLVIGNGWISPEHQYDAYLDFAHAKGLVKEGSDLDKQMQDSLADCHDEMAKEPGHVDYGGCERILSRMLAGLRSGSGNDECVNMYDVRLRDAYPKCGMNWPPDLEYMEPYLQTSAVTEALHVNAARNMGWAECNGNVGNAFSAKKSRASVELLPSLVEEVPILLFSGAEDLICNHLGTEAMINDMEWNGGKGFELTPGNWAPRRNWTFEGDYAGFWQEARNLTYVLFTEASHMVPFDWPRRSRDMLDRFMRVDISSIGGQPSDSRIDGEKLPETTVGGSKEDQQEKADHDAAKDRAKWEAYRRSGEIVLVIVVVASVAWGYFVWSQRRQGNSAYHALGGGSIQMRGVRRQSSHGSSSHGGGRNDGDLESTAFAETDDEEEQGGGHHLRPSTSRQSRSASGSSGGKYTSDEEGGEKPKAKGSPVFVMK